MDLQSTIFLRFLGRYDHLFVVESGSNRFVTLFILLRGPHADFSAVPRQLGYKAGACQSYSGSVLSLDEHANIGPYPHPKTICGILSYLHLFPSPSLRSGTDNKTASQIHRVFRSFRKFLNVLQIQFFSQFYPLVLL